MESEYGLQRKCSRDLSNGAPNGRLDLESAISPLVPLTMSLWSFKTCITTVWDLVSQCEGEAHSRRNYGLEFCIVLLSWQIWTNSFFFKDWAILFIHPSLPLSSLRPFPDNLKLPIYFLRTSQHGFPLPQPRSSMKLSLFYHASFYYSALAFRFLFFLLSHLSLRFQNNPGFQAFLCFSLLSRSPFFFFFLIL